MATGALPPLRDIRDESGQERYEAMFRDHYEMVYRTAYSILNNTADAEDVLQNVFLHLLGRPRPPEFTSNVAGYCYRAAVNHSLDVIRSRRRYELVAHVERFDRAAESGAERAEQLHRRLTKALSELRPEAAHILILRYVHNYSDARIARLLGTSRVAMAVRLFRARSRLKKLMGEEQ